MIKGHFIDPLFALYKVQVDDIVDEQYCVYNIIIIFLLTGTHIHTRARNAINITILSLSCDMT